MAKIEKYREKIRIKNSIIKEIWAVILIILALFIFLSINMPKSMGILGHFINEIILRSLFGNTVNFLPFFILASAVSLLFFHLKTSWKKYIFSFLGLFLSFDLLYELFIAGKPQFFSEISFNGKNGGIVGFTGNFILTRIIGYEGTILFLVGFFIISFILLFNFSFIRLIKIILPKPIEEQENVIPTIKQDMLKEETEEEQKPKILNKFKSIFENRKNINNKKAILDLSNETNEKDHNPDSDKDEPYCFPAISILDTAKSIVKSKDKVSEYSQQAKLLEETLLSFGVEAKVINITPGPSVTRFELEPGIGVKISKITTLSKDIALKLAAPDVRIEAPIPGKALIGIEVPNSNVDIVSLRYIFETTSFLNLKSKLISALGLTITGDAILMDLAKMPHVLIAGATGSGKSVCVNSIILSILYKAKPSEVKFLMIDPKKVELSLYEGIPHLIAPVVTDPNKAAATLKKWAILEMERRYEEFSKVGVRNIEGYNSFIRNLNDLWQNDKEEAKKKIISTFQTDADLLEEDLARYCQTLPYIVVIIDELADLMMVASQDVETTICRLAQMARATGIHLVVATQRPSVNVVTGLIKANIPSRISFFLQSQIDSRTIIDMPGAEKLLGRGDMLYMPVGSFKPQRIQGVFINEKEVKRVVEFLKKQGTPNYLNEIIEVEPLSSNDKNGFNSEDELFERAREIVINTQHASISYLQRKLRIGYNRAARLMEELETQGVISPYDPERKGRKIVSNN